MTIEAYINFNGNCREAVEYYAQVFGTDKPQIMAFGDGPQDPSFQLPEEAKHLVMHAELIINGSRVMFSDTFPGTPFIQGNNFSLTFLSKDVAEIQSVFDKLKEGGSVEMELQETFWSKYYGMLIDKFGIQWQFSHNNR
nr:VOC family protein [uncultured Bacillus sp.]